MIFDYTKQKTQDTFSGGNLSRYRILHWLSDIIKNFFSDPINIKDERLARLLQLQDGEEETKLNGLVDIDTPYTQESTKACITPVILISLGESLYPIKTISVVGNTEHSMNGALGSIGMKHRIIKLQITVHTESYDGTVLLTDLLESFLCINESNLVADNKSISEFRVLGSSAIEYIQPDKGLHAKPVYKATISVSVVGGISWISDTQGPTFRGVTAEHHLT